MILITLTYNLSYKVPQSTVNTSVSIVLTIIQCSARCAFPCECLHTTIPAVDHGNHMGGHFPLPTASQISLLTLACRQCQSTHEFLSKVPLTWEKALLAAVHTMPFLNSEQNTGTHLLHTPQSYTWLVKSLNLSCMLSQNVYNTPVADLLKKYITLMFLLHLRPLAVCFEEPRFCSHNLW